MSFACLRRGGGVLSPQADGGGADPASGLPRTANEAPVRASPMMKGGGGGWNNRWAASERVSRVQTLLSEETRTDRPQGVRDPRRQEGEPSPPPPPHTHPSIPIPTHTHTHSVDLEQFLSSWRLRAQGARVRIFGVDATCQVRRISPRGRMLGSYYNNNYYFFNCYCWMEPLCGISWVLRNPRSVAMS